MIISKLQRQVRRAYLMTGMVCLRSRLVGESRNMYAIIHLHTNNQDSWMPYWNEVLHFTGRQTDENQLITWIHSHLFPFQSNDLPSIWIWNKSVTSFCAFSWNAKIWWYHITFIKSVKVKWKRIWQKSHLEGVKQFAGFLLVSFRISSFYTIFTTWWVRN